MLWSCRSSCEINCVLQHSILIQPNIYDLDDCIMSLILIDQVLTIVYQIGRASVANFSDVVLKKFRMHMEVVNI